MLVYSKFKGPVSAPIVKQADLDEEGLGKAHNDTKLVSVVGPNENFILYNGWNLVPEETWKAIQGHLKYLFEEPNPMLTVRVKKDSVGKELADMESLELSDLSATEQDKIIKEVFNHRDIRALVNSPKLASDVRHTAQIQKKALETGEAPEWGDSPQRR